MEEMFTQEELEAIENESLTFYRYHEPGSLRAFIDNSGVEDLDNFEDAFCGVFFGANEDEAIGNYAEELCDDIVDMRDVPDFIKWNIDWTGVGYDFRVAGDNYALHLGGSDYAVFRNI